MALPSEAPIIGRQPWGTSAHTACRWSFSMLAASGTMPSVLGDLRGPTKARRELASIELAGQAAQIRGMVERLPDPVAAAYLIARYMPRPMEERIQGGGREFVDRFGYLRDPAEQRLAVWLEAQAGTGVHRVRGYREIVAQYCLGDRLIDRIRRLTRREMGIDRVAKLLKMRKADALRLREDSTRKLKDLDEHAHALMDGRLYDAGLII